MDASDLLKAGRLQEARAALIEAVKTRPSDIGRRTGLFQVLAYLGEWDKARRHLETIAAQDASRTVGVQMYLNIIQAELERCEVFEKQSQPSFLPGAPAYHNHYLLAREALHKQDVKTAAAAFDRIDGMRPAISGTLNGQPFTGFKDTDALLAYYLEAFVHERYVWIPFEMIRELIVPEPGDFLDLLWSSAQLTLWDGMTLNCYLPVLYPNTSAHSDDQMKLGRLTDWKDLGRDLFSAVGQHVYQTQESEVALLEIREATFNPPRTEKADENAD